MSVSVTLWRVGAVTFTEDQIRLIAVFKFSTIASPILKATRINLVQCLKIWYF